MSFTNYLETEILDHVFAGAAYTAPGTHYLALLLLSQMVKQVQ